MSATVLSGLAIGAIYALLAIALIIAYRTSRVINLAQGDTGAVAAFLYYALVVEGGRSILSGAFLAVGLSVLIGIATYVFIVRWLSERRETLGLVVTLALASLLQLATAAASDGSARHFPAMSDLRIRIADLSVSGAQLAILACAIVLALILAALFRSTPGLRIRAVGEDADRPRLLGVRTHRVAIIAWATAGAISGLSALLVAQVVRFEPSYMFALLLPALVAALAAGLSSAPVAAAVSLALGVAQAVLQFSLPVPGLDIVVLLIAALLVITRLRPAALEAR